MQYSKYQLEKLKEEISKITSQDGIFDLDRLPKKEKELLLAIMKKWEKKVKTDKQFQNS